MFRRADAKTCIIHADMRIRPRSKTPRKNRRERNDRGEKELYFRRFVSIDGEATTKAGAYGLIATSSGAYLQNRQGLGTEEMLDFLLALPKYHTTGGGKPIYVGFAIDYDVNMILGDLPFTGEQGSIEELRAKGRTRWHGYTITYYHRKIFRVSRGRKTVTWYDTWGYFQSSFERALSAWDIPVPAIITEGKAARGSFHRWSLDKLREYNNAELACHVELMQRLRHAISPLNLTVYSWHGPAALAGYWMASNDVKNYLTDLTPNMRDVAARAYIGGRIDTRGYGFVDPCYHADIVSAYPSATRYLPDLTRITWKRVKGVPAEIMYAYPPVPFVAHIRWQVPDDTLWPPFPWRKSDGTIRYPPSGEGWYWHHELQAAREMHGDCFEVLETYIATGDIVYPLRELIEETFAYRAALKAEGNPSHVPVKLILNSIYGKFAQQIGKAQYHNLVWAGLITSHTRAQLMRAITPATVLVMTDSMWSSEPLSVPTSPDLGGWQHEDETRMVIAEAGLYKAWEGDKDGTTWQRGFDRHIPVDIPEIVSNWLDDDPMFSPVYPVHRFVGMGLATITSYPWRTWQDIERRIHPVPIVGTTKRLPDLPAGLGRRQGQFMSLLPRPADNDECSSPYVGKTMDDTLVEVRMQDEVFDDAY